MVEQRAHGADAAVEQLLPPAGRPAPGADARAGEVDDRVDAFEGIGAHPVVIGLPQRIGLLARAASQAHHIVPLRLQVGGEGAADQPRAAADRYAHGVIVTHRVNRGFPTDGLVAS